MHENTSALPETESERLPVSGLLALAMTGFIAILTETLPAGLLPQIGMSFNVSEALAGQLVTLYALGSLVAAIPLTAATRGWRRRPVLLLAIVGFLIFNTITALSSHYFLTLVARFLAGVAAGLAWGLLAGYARRMVPVSLQGRAMAVAMVGTPIALSLGVPVGTWVGNLIGWRGTFGTMSGLTLILVAWVMLKVPDFPGQSADRRIPVHKVFTTAGVRPVLLVILFWMLAHNILYTYIAPFVVPAGLLDRIDFILLIFGVAALLGIWIIGLLVDSYLRISVLFSLSVFILTAIMLGFGGKIPLVIYLAVALWGLTFGGAATLLQTASADAAGDGADVAQSMVVTVWNLAIAGGGIVGGILLETSGVSSFPWVICILLLLGLIVAWQAKKYSFPHRRQVSRN
ncbi:MFS transporter [Xenorhabdus sp. DI]|uniref:MFS transporter n=1 Tax=Xenorhabdus doucetiae TaxID=351671 RepID=UPI0019B140DE|nr:MULTISPECIES: MFS transporter [unclassified Xenorhabdus]MBD2783816.1 MFS transporter [Xenorhabdus sp. 3]MBD2787037.1 MFS transporter [Xenorhabdus sp. DI]